MSKVTLLADGIKLGRRAGGNPSPSKRGEVSGWSLGSARRNADFLMSIDGDALAAEGGFALAFTLTVGTRLPDSAQEWERLRRAFLERLRRLGLVQLHWLTEFQERGAPHLHGFVVFPDPVWPSQIIDGWLDLVGDRYGARDRGQHIRQVDALRGWKVYLGKHGARSVRHYQRAGLPPGWRKTGRLWGKSGVWPTRSEALSVSPEVFYRLRRVVDGAIWAEAREALRRAESHGDAQGAAIARSRLGYLRRRRRSRTRALSEVSGRTEWLSPSVVRRWLEVQSPGSVWDYGSPPPRP